MDPRPGDGDAPGDLVFLSYSHEDAVWVQRFAVLLKPLLRNRRLRLWVDTSLRGGDAWRPEIEAAIARSTAALLLVSADFLASDFVLDEELPALVRHGVRLLPVLVGDCLWEEEPALADVQWLHDPRRDGSLGRHAGDPGRRDEQLVAACRTLVAALPGVSAAELGRTAVVPAGTVAEVPVSPSAGALSGVPDDPPGYVVRDELATLLDAVTATDSGGAVGVTAEAPVGLFGQGGIGKSVLAAALGREHRTRQRFPDGLFWVTVGERPDVLAVQLDLLARLGDRRPAPRTIHDATGRLRDVLRERRVLLLVDDVWSDAAAHAFRVTGPRGRVVYTTRERRVVAAVGGREFAIGVLSAPAARAVAAAVLGTAAAALPEAADRACAEVDRVALAVALLAAAVRGGRSWDAVAAELRREVDVYGDHPYANTFKAMQVAVATLPRDLASALLGLAVFPPDTAVPVAAVARYWAHTRGSDVDASRDLDRLAAANVLRRDGDGIGFHDLQHDYLLLHSAGLPALHADLLDAYRALLPLGSDGWWGLPQDEPYVRDHLVAHLAGAGERRVLAATVTDPAYLARRIGGSGLHGAEADLARADEALPEHPLIGWWRRWLARHAPFLATSGTAPLESAGPTMLAWLQADATVPAGVDPDRLTPVLPAPYLAVRSGLASPEPALVRALTGHCADVRAVDWSPDGTVVAGGCADGEVRLWNPDTGDTVAVVDAEGDPVATVVWSPDGRRLAVVTTRVRVYDRRGRPVAPPMDGILAVRDLAWSPDGRRLAVVDDPRGRGLRLYDPLDAHTDQLVVDHRREFTHVAWSADGRSLATADRRGVVEVWEVASRRRTGAARDFSAPVSALAWAPRSATLAIAGAGRIRRWRPADDTVDVLGRHLDVGSVAWSPTDDRLASGGRDVRVWDPAGGRPVRLGSHTDLVASVAWSPDGARLATAGGDREVQVWDTTTAGADVGPDLVSGWIRAVAVSCDGRIATLGGDRWGRSRSVQVRGGAAGRTAVVTVAGTVADEALVWSADGRFLHVVGVGWRRWERATGRTTVVDGRVNSRGLGSCTATAWAPGGRGLAVGYQRSIRIWKGDGSDATVIRRPGGVTALAWSTDAARLAACGANTTGHGVEIGVWTIGDERVRARLRLGDTGYALPAWSPDSARLAVAVPHRPPILWEPATGRTTTLAGPGGAVTGVVWSPDGRHVLTTGEDGAVVVHPVDGTRGSRVQLAGANCVAWEGSTIVVGQRTGPAVLELRGPPA